MRLLPGFRRGRLCLRSVSNDGKEGRRLPPGIRWASCRLRDGNDGSGAKDCMNARVAHGYGGRSCQASLGLSLDGMRTGAMLYFKNQGEIPDMRSEIYFSLCNPCFAFNLYLLPHAGHCCFALSLWPHSQIQPV